MKAVILAAGRCTRIRAVTNGLPKCLLQFCGQAILDHQLDSLFGAGVEDIAIVVGYQKDQITRHVTQRHPNQLRHIKFITNPEYATTNNIYSLWLARDWLGHAKSLCLNADVLYHPDILPPALATPADISVVIDRDFREETTKVIIRNGRILALSKSITRQEYSGTFIGIATLSPQGKELLFAKIESEIATGLVNGFFNDAISHLSAEGVRVGYTETAGLPWAEIDDPNDLTFAQSEVFPRMNSTDFSDQSPTTHARTNAAEMAFVSENPA